VVVYQDAGDFAHGAGLPAVMAARTIANRQTYRKGIAVPRKRLRWI